MQNHMGSFMWSLSWSKDVCQNMFFKFHVWHRPCTLREKNPQPSFLRWLPDRCYVTFQGLCKQCVSRIYENMVHFQTPTCLRKNPPSDLIPVVRTFPKRRGSLFWMDSIRFPSQKGCRYLWCARKVVKSQLGGGFKYLLFSSLPGEGFHFDKYFSNGLKPPTSWRLLIFKSLEFPLKIFQPPFPHTIVDIVESSFSSVDSSCLFLGWMVLLMVQPPGMYKTLWILG